MASNLLNKEFQEKDIQRLRNLITKKYGEKTVSSVGYEKEHVEHQENDVWEEDGRTWTIKKGIKQNITKLDSVKKQIFIPLLCPCCNKNMNHPYDKKFYNLHGKCFNCVIEFETKLKAEGKFEEYEKEFMKKNMFAFVNDARSFIENLEDENNGSFFTEQGDREKWIGGNESLAEKRKKMLEDLDSFLEQINK